MPKPKKTSVIICTKNRMEETIRCIDSILVQTYFTSEIIVVDASESQELASRFKRLNDGGKIKIIYIHSEPGLTQQRNLGVRASCGDIVFFFDDDIVLKRDFIQEIIRIFERDPQKKIGGVMGDITNVYKARADEASWVKLFRCIFFLPGFGNGKFCLSGFNTGLHGTRKIAYTEFLSGGLTAYRREVLDEFSFDENLRGCSTMEDVDFSYRVSRKYHNVFNPYARCTHFPSPKDRLSSKTRRNLLIVNHTYLFRKNIPQTLLHKIAFRISLIGLRLEPDTHDGFCVFLWRCFKVIMKSLLGRRIVNFVKMKHDQISTKLNKNGMERYSQLSE